VSRSASGIVFLLCTRRCARLASGRAASGERSTIGDFEDDGFGSDGDSSL
jgi:hypothetical protein